MTEIARAGIVAKTRLAEAAGVVAELAGWLEARGVRPVFDAETAALVGLPPDRETWSRDELPRECDLVIVLGGDGTLIGMAGRVAAAGLDLPDPRRQLRQPRAFSPRSRCRSSTRRSNRSSTDRRRSSHA